MVHPIGARGARTAVNTVHHRLIKRIIQKETMQPESLNQTIENLLRNLKAPTHYSKLSDRLKNISSDEIAKILTSVYVRKIADRGRILEEENETADKIRKVAKWLTSSTKPGLLLYGKTGTGKTVLMDSLKEVLMLGRQSGTVHFVTAKNMFDFYCEDSGRYRYERLRSAPIDLIDDLGCEPSRCIIFGVDYEPIRDFFYKRYDQQLITVVSTNLGDKQLADTYGERVWDRISETFDRITFQGDSFRVK